MFCVDFTTLFVAKLTFTVQSRIDLLQYSIGLNFGLRPEIRPKFWSKTERLLSLEKCMQIRSKTKIRSKN